MNQISFRDEEEAGETMDSSTVCVFSFLFRFPQLYAESLLAEYMLGLFWLELIYFILFDTYA